MTAVAVIGGGPRAVGWLERFAANRSAFRTGPVTVHVIDPYPPGPGRIWRREQSRLLMLNSMAADVTLFTDDSVAVAGPVAPGPSLIDWAVGVRGGRIRDVALPDPELRRELEGLTPQSFPTRRLQSRYLDWCYRRAVAGLAPGDEVVEHADTAVGLADLPDGRQRVSLAAGPALEVDAVVVAVGHSGGDPQDRQAELAAFARSVGAFYLPPSFTADAELSPIAAGAPLIVRGMGLAAIDLLVLLTQGRGGRFAPGHDGLRYLPSGGEPRIFIGSRRGVPYHAKITSRLHGVRPGARFFTATVAAELAGVHDLDFTRRVWPLIAKEMLHGYYAELFTGHPDRVRTGWDAFLRRFAPLDPFGAGLGRLVAETVADPGDRLDLAAFARPLAGRRFADRAALQEALRGHIRDDLDRRTQPRHSATLGLFLSLLESFALFVDMAGVADWTAASRAEDLDGWWRPYFSYVASGPPGRRLEELLALSRAGVVTFLGGGMTVTPDPAAGVFRAAGANAPGEVAAAALVDAWLPAVQARRSDDPLLRRLIASGQAREEPLGPPPARATTGRIDVAAGGRMLRADGSVHPRRHALGPFTSAPAVGAFARPGTNALAFRENDAAARDVLAGLAAARPAAGPAAG